MDCLDDDHVLRFAQGQLAATEEGDVQAHLSNCADCRHLVAEAARGISVPAPGKSGSAITDVNMLPAAAMRQVGRYQLLDVIGAGGMGVVYTAFDPQLSRNVALKLVRSASPNPDLAAKSRARLLREAQAMAQLSHPNVVAVFDAGTHEGQVFVAMELVQGDNLKLWLRDKKTHFKQIIEVFCSAGEGLAAAHARGLVHRDFKPDNVLVGADGRVRVTDFGLARLELAEPEVAPAHEASIAARSGSMTETGMLLGTPAYMAPEQLRHQPVDARSDQFSFSVALFEALYGRRPYRLTSDELDAIEFPKDARVPKALVTVLQRGLERSPSARFASMNELLAALKASLHSPRSGRVAAVAGGAAVVAAAIAVAAVTLLRASPVVDVPSPMGEGGRRPGEGAAAIHEVSPPELAHVAAPEPDPTPEPVISHPTIAARPVHHVASKPAHPSKSARKADAPPKPASDDAPIDNPWGGTP